MEVLFSQDEEAWLPTQPGNFQQRAVEAEEVAIDDLADEHSKFIDCEGLKVHYRVALPLVRFFIYFHYPFTLSYCQLYYLRPFVSLLTAVTLCFHNEQAFSNLFEKCRRK